MVSWQAGPLHVMLVDFAGSRLHGEGKQGLGCRKFADCLVSSVASMML